MMNNAVVVPAVSWLRRPWRPFHRRQVTPTSSHQTTLARLGMLDDFGAVDDGVKWLGSGGPDQVRWPAVAREVLPAERTLVQHRDRVVDGAMASVENR